MRTVEIETDDGTTAEVPVSVARSMINSGHAVAVGQAATSSGKGAGSARRGGSTRKRSTSTRSKASTSGASKAKAADSEAGGDAVPASASS